MKNADDDDDCAARDKNITAAAAAAAWRRAWLQHLVSCTEFALKEPLTPNSTNSQTSSLGRRPVRPRRRSHPLRRGQVARHAAV